MTTRADFTIADVLAWARTKPADEPYDYFEPNSCAVAKFGRDTGRTRLIGIPGLMSSPLIPKWLSDAIMDPVWTYGGLVARLEKLCPDAPVPQSEWARIDAYMADELASA